MNYRLQDKMLGLACAALGLYLLFIVGQGVLTGEINQLSKYSEKIIQRSQQPQHFWATLGFFSLGAVFLLSTAFKKLFPNNRR